MRGAHARPPRRPASPAALAAGRLARPAPGRHGAPLRHRHAGPPPGWPLAAAALLTLAGCWLAAVSTAAGLTVFTAGIGWAAHRAAAEHRHHRLAQRGRGPAGVSQAARFSAGGPS